MTHADREQVKILTEKIDTMNVRMHSLSELCDGFYKDWGIALARTAELERQLADMTTLFKGAEKCTGLYATESRMLQARVAELKRLLAESARREKHLRSACDSYAKEAQKFHDEFWEARRAAEAAESRVATLEHALRKYGNHTAECGLETERTGSPDYQCTCGFADAITGAVSSAPPAPPDATPQEDGT